MSLFHPREIGARAAIGALLVLAFAAPGRAASVEDFYKGRSIAMVIGYSVGGGYDLYARVVAQHLGDHIPGHPTVVPQNMPGAGSLKAATYLYAVAPKDGTTIGTFGRTMALEPLLGTDAQYDGTKFSWLGSVTNDVTVCVTWNSSPIASWADMMSKNFTLGGEGSGADPDVAALMIKNIFGAKIKLVTGYPGTADVTLAMERGEIDGLCGISYSTVKSRHADWLRDKKVHLLVQAALQKSADLPDVPLVMDFAKTPDQRQILKLLLASQAMARPFLGPPGIPADRLAALRKAFDETMSDPAFLADAKKLDFDVNPVTGAAIDALLSELYATPKDVVATAAHAIVN